MRVLITGSADGPGQMAAKLLVADGHEAVLHARHSDTKLYDFLLACEKLSGVSLRA